MIDYYLEKIINSKICLFPFKHWEFDSLLPPDYAKIISEFQPNVTQEQKIDGKRIDGSNLRYFVKREDLIFEKLIDVFKNESFILRLELITGKKLNDSLLRIEYCIDRDGFWLEPHTDIFEKFFTLILYLPNTKNYEDLGTNLYNLEKYAVKEIAYRFNNGFFFVPHEKSWHGFEKREISQERRTLIINYVTSKWRDTYQICY